MSHHQFTVLVEGTDMQNDEAAAALFEAGCDDATVGTSHGTQYLDFDREADSFTDAIASAVRAIEKALPGARVVRIADASDTTPRFGIRSSNGTWRQADSTR